MRANMMWSTKSQRSRPRGGRAGRDRLVRAAGRFFGIVQTDGPTALNECGWGLDGLVS